MKSLVIFVESVIIFIVSLIVAFVVGAAAGPDIWAAIEDHIFEQKKPRGRTGHVDYSGMSDKKRTDVSAAVRAGEAAETARQQAEPLA